MSDNVSGSFCTPKPADNPSLINKIIAEHRPVVCNKKSEVAKVEIVYGLLVSANMPLVLFFIVPAVFCLLLHWNRHPFIEPVFSIQLCQLSDDKFSYRGIEDK